MTTNPVLLGCFLAILGLQPSVAFAEGVDSSCFDGNWEWIAKAKNKDGSPAGTCELSLTKKGKQVVGEVSASQGYGARLEEGSPVTGTVTSSRKAELRFESLRGSGQIVARVTCQGSNLAWEIISNDVNDSAFPDKVILHRALIQ